MKKHTPKQDYLQRFSFAQVPVRGQWVRLEGVLDRLLSHQPYPANVQSLLAQMLAAVAMVADGLKFKGAVSLQSRGTGPLTTVLAECRSQNLLRGIARLEDEATIPDTDSIARLLGDGQLVLSLIPDDSAQTPATAAAYQGIIGLVDEDLAGNLQRYFADSEQLPTRLFFAGEGHRATGLLLQRMPAAKDEDNNLWEEIVLLAQTVSESELDQLSPADLLKRLFAQHPLTLHPARKLSFACTCNRGKTSNTLQALGREELLEILAEQGSVTITCEICGQIYNYDAVDVHVLLSDRAPDIH